MASDLTPRARNLLRRGLDAVPAKWWIFAAVGVVLAASALFGGLDDADASDDALPELSAGETFVADELTTTVTDARLSSTLPDNLYSEPEEGRRFLIVSATITNNFRTSTTALAPVLVLDLLANDPDHSRPRVLLASDNTGLPQAPPRVPIDVLYIWEVPEGSIADGDDIEVGVTSRSYFTQNSVTYGDRWQDPVEAAIVTLRVTEVVVQPEPEPEIEEGE